MTQTFAVVIRQKSGLLWQGEVNSLSSTNEVGVFDILPEHSNFVCLVEKHIIIRFGNTKKEWPIERGILNVKDGSVEVYLGY